MKKLPNKILFSVIIATISLFLLSSYVKAQTARTLTIIPPSVPISIDPGKQTEGEMKIINDSSSEITFEVDIQDFIVVDNIGTPNLLPPNTLNNKYSAAAWIGVTPNKFTLAPGQRQNLNYYIQVPPDAKPGGHYAAAVYKPATDTTTGGTGSVINAQLGTLFSIAVSGDVTEKAEVTSFKTAKFHEYGPAKILTQIKNSGDLHITPKGSLSITDLFGKTITQDLKPQNIFPGGIARDYENTIGEGFMIGRYKATLLATYGVANNIPLSATFYFWVFPWRLAVILILLTITVILGVLFWRKRKENKHKKLEHEQVDNNA